VAKSRPDDFRDNAWPRGLYRRNLSYRFRRVHNGQKVNKSLGELSERQAHREQKEAARKAKPAAKRVETRKVGRGKGKAKK
jgi:hypothetical protein